MRFKNASRISTFIHVWWRGCCEKISSLVTFTCCMFHGQNGLTNIFALAMKAFYIKNKTCAEFLDKRSKNIFKEVKRTNRSLTKTHTRCLDNYSYLCTGNSILNYATNLHTQLHFLTVETVKPFTFLTSFDVDIDNYFLKLIFFFSPSLFVALHCSFGSIFIASDW